MKKVVQKVSNEISVEDVINQLGEGKPVWVGTINGNKKFITSRAVEDNGIGRVLINKFGEVEVLRGSVEGTISDYFSVRQPVFFFDSFTEAAKWIMGEIE